MLLRASLKTSLILVKYLCKDLRNCFYFILYWNVQKWYSTSVGLFRNYSTWITFIRLFQSLLGHFSLFFSSVLRETPFSRSCRIDKCPAVCVNGADESVREKRRHIVGVKTFIDKKKHTEEMFNSPNIWRLRKSVETHPFPYVTSASGCWPKRITAPSTADSGN